jgi:hypothetical protein
MTVRTPFVFDFKDINARIEKKPVQETYFCARCNDRGWIRNPNTLKWQVCHVCDNRDGRENPYPNQIP